MNWQEIVELKLESLKQTDFANAEHSMVPSGKYSTNNGGKSILNFMLDFNDDKFQLVVHF